MMPEQPLRHEGRRVDLYFGTDEIFRIHIGQGRTERRIYVNFSDMDRTIHWALAVTVWWHAVVCSLLGECFYGPGLSVKKGSWPGWFFFSANPQISENIVVGIKPYPTEVHNSQSLEFTLEHSLLLKLHSGWGHRRRPRLRRGGAKDKRSKNPTCDRARSLLLFSQLRLWLLCRLLFLHPAVKCGPSWRLNSELSQLSILCFFSLDHLIPCPWHILFTQLRMHLCI